MQKFLLALLITVMGNSVLAQNIDDIKDLINKGQWDKAKTSVDAFLTKEKNAAKWEGWWYKGVIYNEIAKSEQFKSLVPDGRMEAFNAFKKYYETDPKMLQALLEQHVRLFDIYSGYFDAAAARFNEKKYDEAFTSFRNAYTVEEYIASKGFEYNNFKFPAFDTTLIQNIALSAYMAKKEDDAAIYYKKIADQKIAGKDFIDVYQFMVDYYNKKNDLVNREKYLQTGRELYPDDDFWYQTELADADDKDKKALFARYEELGSKYPNKHVLFYNYAVELFNYAYARDAKPADYKEIQKKIETVVRKILSIKSNYTEANVIMARHFYNVSFDLQDEMVAIKGNTAADQKKKADIKAMLLARSEELIPYAQAAYDAYDAKATLKPLEKANFKIVTDMLVSAYELKGDKVKMAEYKKKLEGIDNISTSTKKDDQTNNDNQSNGTVEIIMKPGNGGVFIVPCKVNGFPLDFIFDTGASNVVISLAEAIVMIKQNKLTDKDIIGTSYAQLADGKITENTKIILREIEIGGLKLKDVSASVTHNLQGSLLLGMSAIGKLGKIQIEGNKLIIFAK